MFSPLWQKGSKQKVIESFSPSLAFGQAAQCQQLISLDLPWEGSSISPQFWCSYPKFPKCLKVSFHSGESRTTRTYVGKIQESIPLLFSRRCSVCCSQPEQSAGLQKHSNSLGQISFFLMKTCYFQ